MKMIILLRFILICLLGISHFSCQESKKMKVIFDTDANNELDDQFALAYLLFNGASFDVEGVTVNATKSGGNIEEHFEEAKRILQLSQRYEHIPLLMGADGSFESIRNNLEQDTYDGAVAVEFIIESAHQYEGELVLIAVGKLTNDALALEKDPSIASKIRVVWLGSNYPKPGEYNQENDTAAVNYVLSTYVPFEMVTVRYGESSGTDAVRVTQEEINLKMPGKGPRIQTPVRGRHGGEFYTFGDYGVNLFKHIDYHGDPPSRALFDMVAVAILKNPSWAESKEIPAPVLKNGEWVDQPDNERKITVWENFDNEKILEDFYETMSIYELVETKKK